MGVQRHALVALPPGKTRYPLYRKLGGPQGRSGQIWKISAPLGFDSRPVQLVANRYTDGRYLGPKKLLNIKFVFDFFLQLQLLSEIFLILRRIERDVIKKNVYWSSRKLPVIRVRC